MDDELFIQDHADLDQLLVNIECALRVKKRPDFFSWVQGVFQAMIPHECLICALATPGGGGLQMDWMASFPVSPPQFAELSRPDDGLVHQLINRWQRSAWRPVRVEPEDDLGAGADEVLIRLLDGMRLRNTVAHGLPGLDGRPLGFFAFFQVGGKITQQHVRRLQLLLPYLHAAFLRASIDRPQITETRPGPTADVLTQRESEILHWVQRGKSNSEIAQILSISPLTVKNHVQKILRKLNVQNRAQAVARGMSLKLTGMPA